jgi:hypothetical protein
MVLSTGNCQNKGNTWVNEVHKVCWKQVPAHRCGINISACLGSYKMPRCPLFRLPWQEEESSVTLKEWWLLGQV